MNKLNLQDLHILHLIHYHQSITAAAEAVQLSQSAMSRRLQLIELELGVQVFVRTTRSLSITDAGKQLLRDTASIPNIIDSAIQRLSEDFLGVEKRIKIGISSSLSLAHLPGIFHAQARHHADVKTIISQPSRNEILKNVANNKLDIGIVDYDKSLDKIVVIHHAMMDQFCLVIPAGVAQPSLATKHFKKWCDEQSWILPEASSVSREMLDDWVIGEGITIEPSMELESFDLMCQLVALKMGVALVPRRALTAFPRKKQLQAITLQNAPVRKLCVIGPKNTVVAEHMNDFIGSILFS